MREINMHLYSSEIDWWKKQFQNYHIVVVEIQSVTAGFMAGQRHHIGVTADGLVKLACHGDLLLMLHGSDLFCRLNQCWLYGESEMVAAKIWQAFSDWSKNVL